jgi:hypothetical protein
MAADNGFPPNLIPGPPINIPGNIVAPTLVSGNYQNFFQPQQPIVPLATKLGDPLSPPEVVPPLTFQLVTNG